MNLNRIDSKDDNSLYVFEEARAKVLFFFFFPLDNALF